MSAFTPGWYRDPVSQRLYLLGEDGKLRPRSPFPVDEGRPSRLVVGYFNGVHLEATEAGWPHRKNIERLNQDPAGCRVEQIGEVA